MVRRKKNPLRLRCADFGLKRRRLLAPGGTRTPDLLLRRQLLYPVELRAGWDVAVDLGIIQILQDGASLLYRRKLR